MAATIRIALSCGHCQDAAVLNTSYFMRVALMLACHAIQLL
jgi:hypothetical protein